MSFLLSATLKSVIIAPFMYFFWRIFSFLSLHLWHKHWWFCTFFLFSRSTASSSLMALCKHSLCFIFIFIFTRDGALSFYNIATPRDNKVPFAWNTSPFHCLFNWFVIFSSHFVSCMHLVSHFTVVTMRSIFLFVAEATGI